MLSVRCWFAAALALLASGCRVGPDFAHPTSPPADRYTATELTTTDSADDRAGQAQSLSVARDVPEDWWSSFRSAALTQLVTTALRDNPGIEAAVAQLRQLREQELASQASLWPQVSAQLGISRQRQPEADIGADSTPAVSYNQYSASLDLGYSLDFWGRLRRRVEQSGAQVDYQHFQVEAARLALSAGVAGSVVAMASLQQQLRVQDHLIDLEQQQLGTVRQQFEAGAATGTDVATQEAQVAQSRFAAEQLQTRLVQSRNQLAAYLGRAPATAVIPNIELDALSLPTQLPVTIPARLLEQRPDLLAAEALVHQQTAALGEAIAMRLPDITIQGSAGTTATRSDQILSRAGLLWSIGAQLTQPVFDAGRLAHAQRAQEAQLQASTALWRNQAIVAFQNVADVLTALQNDATALRHAVSAEHAAARSLYLATEQYRLGGVSYLSVLATEQGYQSAALTLIQARAARFLDTIALYQSLGGGWWNRNDERTAP